MSEGRCKTCGNIVQKEGCIVCRDDTKKALAILETIRKCDVGAEVIIHNSDGSIYCILKKTAEEEER